MSASEGIHISSTPSASASVLDSLTSNSSTLSPPSIPPASQNIGDDSISGKFDINLKDPLVFEYLNAIMGRAYRENRYDHAKYFQVLTILKKRYTPIQRCGTRRLELARTFCWIFLRAAQEVLEEVTQLREEVQELRSRKGEIEEVTQLREEVQELRGIRDEMHQYRQMMEKMQQFITANMGSCSTSLQTFQRQFPPPPPPSTAI
ncbi:hypothetical protein FNV43_RR05929 [Rhamnella rubrinervis]|uniref:Uncharacterized protein n=1 Tax=Rhamnella rubrinervis TaxID=2594499 RepID=A0A8K0HDH6_9ROSA|nr:hypothetical protein FNV43_RR05929 [Rhamnella rubrinervis]